MPPTVWAPVTRPSPGLGPADGSAPDRPRTWSSMASAGTIPRDFEPRCRPDPSRTGTLWCCGRTHRREHPPLGERVGELVQIGERVDLPGEVIQPDARPPGRIGGLRRRRPRTGRGRGRCASRAPAGRRRRAGPPGCRLTRNPRNVAIETRCCVRRRGRTARPWLRRWIGMAPRIPS